MNEPIQLNARASDVTKHPHELDRETADMLTLTRNFDGTGVTVMVFVFPCGCVGLARLTAVGPEDGDSIDLLADGQVPALYTDFVAEVVRLGRMQAQVRMAVVKLEQALAGGLQS